MSILGHPWKTKFRGKLIFVDRRIFEVMAYPSSEKLDILININRNLAAGLRGEQTEAA